MTLDTQIQQQVHQSVNLRHGLHQIPELGYQEFKTAAAIRAELARLGIKCVEGPESAPTATIAWLGDVSKPCIALRGNIDALPTADRRGPNSASPHPGLRPAWGHAGPPATLLGVAAILKSIESTLPVCVKLLWQPAEE